MAAEIRLGKKKKKTKYPFLKKIYPFLRIVMIIILILILLYLYMK